MSGFGFPSSLSPARIYYCAGTDLNAPVEEYVLLSPERTACAKCGVPLAEHGFYDLTVTAGTRTGHPEQPTRDENA